jgi:cyclic beta-1,2-glucan synthetase
LNIKITLLEKSKSLKKKFKYAYHINNVLTNIIDKDNYNLNFNKLVNELNLYQKENKIYFSYREIDLIPTLLLFIYTSKLNELCQEEKQRLDIEDEVSNKIKKLENEEINLEDFISNDADIINSADTVFEINNQLKELGSRSNETFKELNHVLESNKINLKDMLNSEYQVRIDSNMLIANIFGALKDFFELDDEKLFENVCLTEQKLNCDEVYSKMTTESKYLYRDRIVKLAKRYHMTEYDYVIKLMSKALDEKKHIGFYLLGNNHCEFNAFIYITFIIAISILSTYFLSAYFISNRILGFIILFIPVSQLYIKLVNYIVTNVVAPKPLPKLDYSKGIPSESATMVVIPTILNDPEKVKNMFDTLETYYLANKSSNLYFTLAGDPKSCDKESYYLDDNIIATGIKCANDLNKKYGQQNILFYLS